MTGSFDLTFTSVFAAVWPAVFAQMQPAPDDPGLATWIPVTALILLLLGLLYATYQFGRKQGARGSARVKEAGRWVLNQAQPSPGPDITRQLEYWLSRIKSAADTPSVDINEELAIDLDLAKDFQLAYLERPYPKIPATHYEGRLRLAFHHYYHPALALGGDFYDILPLADDTAGVLIADVMGHGTRSALITAMLRTLLRDLKGQGRNARHFITSLNQALCEVMRSFPQPLFASAFYFVPDTTSRMATFSTAGHPAPFHIHRDVGRITRLNVPAPHGAALGIMPKEEYTGGHARLIDNDGFIFFTDGAYEAANEAGEEFGLPRMEEVIRRFMYKDVRTIIEELGAAIRRFSSETALNDDICMVGVDITTKPAEPDEDEPKRT